MLFFVLSFHLFTIKRVYRKMYVYLWLSTSNLCVAILFLEPGSNLHSFQSFVEIGEFHMDRRSDMKGDHEWEKWELFILGLGKWDLFTEIHKKTEIDLLKLLTGKWY